MGLCLCKCIDAWRVPERLYAVSAPMEPVGKVYSWDRRPLGTIEQCSCNGLVDSTKLLTPDSMTGQQFTIENCQGCSIVLLDRTASVIIDDCKNCQIVLGPCSGSVFIRGSVNCCLWVLCQQFRVRDCRNLQVSLFCQSEPSLESSTCVDFTCLQISYCQLDAQIGAAGLKTLNNFWAHAHDFSADETPIGGGGVNFFCSQEVRAPVLDGLEAQQLEQCKLSFDPLDSLIPLTAPWSKRLPRPSQVSFLSILLTNDAAANLAKSISLSKALASSCIDVLGTAELSTTLGGSLFADRTKTSDLLTKIPLAVFVIPDAKSKHAKEVVQSLDIAGQWSVTNGEHCWRILDELYGTYNL
uniref:C-CAP/cofactor C-like domain-containing protein n=1 Tax=Trichuris muris TaxID=70415 RepID=A0A5S6QVB7_TRIMR